MNIELPNVPRLMVTCCDEGFSTFAKIAVHSFKASNPAWGVAVLDVGLLKHTADALSRIATVISCPRQMCLGHYPAALARLMFMRGIHAGQTVLYLDSDSITYRSVDTFVEAFEKSEYGVSMAYDPEPMYEYWVNAPKFFQNYDRWKDKQGITTGVFLMKQNPCVEIAEESVLLYEKYSPHFKFAEQTPIASLIYERDIPMMIMPRWFHCTTRDPDTSGFPANPRIDGENAVIVHMTGYPKGTLQDLNYLHNRFVGIGQFDLRKHSLAMKKIPSVQFAKVAGDLT